MTNTAEQRRRWNRRYYEEGGKERIQALNKKNRQRNKDYVQALKEALPCTDCGNHFPHFSMQYDHTGDDKIAAISIMVLAGSSIKRLDEEIAKCDLVCANCHLARTWTRTHALV